VRPAPAASLPALLAALTLLGACATPRPTAAPLPIFDAHAHIEPSDELGRINPHAPGTVKALLQQMDRAHVSSSLAIVVPDRDPQRITRANASLEAQSASLPGRLIPVASLPSDDTAEALLELDRVAAAGVRVVKLTPSRAPGEAERLDALIGRAAARHVIVLLDGWTLDLDTLARVALAHPKARLVVAHLGGIRFADALVFDVLRRYSFYTRNVWFDLSNVAHVYARSPYAAQLVWVCRQLGTDRVLFGSDFPLISVDEAVADVRALGFTEAEQRQILHDNAQALFAPAAQSTARAAR
jgi:predicted TIM-barrel fold metal-dependent hydrolase